MWNESWPLWLVIAWAHRNEREISGNGHDPDIMNFALTIGATHLTRDEDAWCATYTGACLERANIKSSRSAMARSYQNYGRDVTNSPKIPPGAIGVQPRTSNPALGHVGFVLEDLGDRVRFISGNVSNKVTIDVRKKSDFITFRWPEGTPSDPEFDTCYELVLAREWDGKQGFSDHPDDNGGPTFKGILCREFIRWRGWADTYKEAKRQERNPQYIEALKNLTDAELRAIYAANYWYRSWSDSMPVALALMHFDCAVNQGVGDARRFLQAAIGAHVDGFLGPQTLHKAGQTDVAKAVQRYYQIRLDDYKSLSDWPTFGRGWTNRINRIHSDALELRDQTPKGPPVMNDTFNEVFGDATASGTTPKTPDRKLAPPPKWWGKSLTIWGGIVSFLSVLTPFLPFLGIPLTSELLALIDENMVKVLQLVGSMIGTAMVVYGRSRATQPIGTQDFQFKVRV